MDPVTSEMIRAAFVNGTKGEAKRLRLPSLESVPWADLDFFGWRDPQSTSAGGLVLWRSGEPLSIMLQATSRPASAKQGMCSFCHTFHTSSDVAFMGAKLAGAKGRAGNTVAAAMCGDLACSLYARKLRQPSRVQPQETIDIDARVARLIVNLDAFVDKVTEGR
ncbi:MAG: FBP domain-containing protein [Propionibacteriaceae bacterium]|nr:FBP domain-containing protein [Propionibacteriaceae bacterium]